jgi:hypothetical protein
MAFAPLTSAALMPSIVPIHRWDTLGDRAVDAGESNPPRSKSGSSPHQPGDAEPAVVGVIGQVDGRGAGRGAASLTAGVDSFVANSWAIAALEYQGTGLSGVSATRISPAASRPSPAKSACARRSGGSTSDEIALHHDDDDAT